MSFRNWTIAAVRSDVHIDGESGTIDDAEQHVARVRAAIDRAKEQRDAVSVGFRALQHAGELTAHDHERDQRLDA